MDVSTAVVSIQAAGCSEFRLGFYVSIIALRKKGKTGCCMLTDWKSTLFLYATLTEGVRSAVPTKNELIFCPRALVMTPADFREAVDAVGCSSLRGIHLDQSLGNFPMTRSSNLAASTGSSS